MKKIIFFFALAVMASSGQMFAQGVTTSSINGKITDNNGGILPGATVIAVHEPSGTKYATTTDFDGFYRLRNMRIGGPYKVTISYVGFNGFVKNNIYLELGQSQRVSTQLQESTNELDEVVIKATNDGLFDSNKTGSGTKISSKKVNALPNISRSITDFARLTPEAQIRGDNTLSIAGQNNRYNAIYIDGAVNNDVFGLAGSGTNGGQTGVNPISIDAIESFQVSVAPFDVTIGGFAGGAITPVTKSGTNEFKGSAYYLLRNEDLAGKTPGEFDDDDDREKLADFSATTYGITAGGPIIKDKLFFFVNYERQDDETPQPFNANDYIGDAGPAGLAQFRDVLINDYGFDPGTFDNNTASLTSDKFLFKLDWNINDNNKLSFRNNYVKANQFDIGRSTATFIDFTSQAVNFESITNTAFLEWSSNFKNMSNNLKLGYTRVRDDRDINGDPFPTIEIRDGNGSTIFAGSEPFSTANLLEQDIFTLTNNFEIYSGAHNITLGTHNEYSDIKNVFFGRNFGEYTYNSFEDFLNQQANEYRSSYSLLGGSGDESIGAAEFDLFQLGFYAQDEVQFTDNLKITFGLRFDVPFWADGRTNEDFNTRGVALLEAAGKDLQGARVGQGPNNSVHVSPRVGFNWDVKGDNTTQVRGGFGIFTSRIPLVWPGGAYNNTGNVVANTRFFRPRPGDTPLPADQQAVLDSFNPDINTQFREEGEFQGNIDLLAEDLKLPQIFKTNIAVDQKIWGGVTLSGEFTYNETVNGVNFENLNLAGTQFTTTGAGPRSNFGFENVDNTYGGIFLVSNTSVGSSWNTSFTISKNFSSSIIDLGAQATYSYGDSDVLFDGGSSQIISNWAFNESVNGSNNLTESTSDFAQGHRVISNLTANIKWSDFTKTTIGVFYEGSQGTPFSYIVNGNGLIADSGEPFVPLPFIPSNFAEAQLVDDGDLTAAQQWELFDAFIEGDDYLRSRRGQFAERNADRARWAHIVDLKFAQEFSINVNDTKHSLALTADIFNFTNLLNNDWGRRFFTSGFDTTTLLNFEGFQADGTTPTYTFNTNIENSLDNIDDAGLNSSRWQMQVGIRYTFN